MENGTTGVSPKKKRVDKQTEALSHYTNKIIAQSLNKTKVWLVKGADGTPQQESVLNSMKRSIMYSTIAHGAFYD